MSIVIGCAPETAEEEVYPFRLDVRDKTQQKVLEFGDRLLTDSLVPYLRHPDPTIRYRAAMEMASVRDSTTVHALGGVLSDEDPNVRFAAAYALGQTGALQAEDVLISGFDAYDSTNYYQASNAAILEAVGKTGGPGNLRNLTSIESYDIRDSLLILGQARGIYRFALRNITSEEGTAVMVDFVASTQLPPSIRVVAANYLFRARNVDTRSHLSTLIPVFRNDRDPRIRMCLATALGKSRDSDALTSLKNQLRREKDYRVRCNILRAMAFYPYSQVKETAFGLVYDENIHVARTAAQVLVDHGTAADAKRYRAVSRGQLPWEVKSMMYLATEKHMSRAYEITKKNMLTELEEWFGRSQNPYERAAVLRAIAGEPANYGAVHRLGYGDDHPAVRTAAVESISSIAGHQDFNRVFGGNARSTRRELVNYLVEAITSGDVAMIAVAAGGLQDPSLRDDAKQHMQTYERALGGITLPDAIETYNALAGCIATLNGENYIAEAVPYNHPIDWQAIDNLRDTVSAEVITSAGTILIDLYVSATPGSCLNFIQLSRNRFYNGKVFHRVVPNFVIQGGCPRGDGYGSLDYTIRSELLPFNYDQGGYIGMASAGNHTECTQWFITHSPTPHLDGNYTIFGKVRSGMDVVHAVQVGDEIREVNIIN